jgi:signal transduction histidine kinase
MSATLRFRRDLVILLAVQCGLLAALGGWHLVAAFRAPSTGDPRETARATSSACAMLCGAAAAAGILALLALGRLGHHLTGMAAVVEAYVHGDLTARVSAGGAEELVRLADAVNGMADEMSLRDEQLEAALVDAARQRDRLSAIINATSDGLLLYDPSRRILAVNDRCGDLLGFQKDRLLSEPLAVLEFELQSRCRQPEQYRERLERHFAHPDSTHQDVLEVERPQRRMLRRYSGPLLNDHVLAGRVFTYTDITSETDLDRMKGEFVSMASHELRTPLTSIHGALQLALMGSGEAVAAEDRELLEISLASTERLVRLVNDLLDLSKIEAGRMPLASSPVEIGSVLSEAARSMQGLASTRGTRIVTERLDGLAPILGDRDQVLRVLANLISNAIKYSPEGTTVTLAAREVTDGIEMSVSDEGPGIPPDQIDRLFKPFTRVGCHERQVEGGTGLGLALSRAIVLQHGGRIWAERRVQRGSRFALVLPVATGTSNAGAHALQAVA